MVGIVVDVHASFRLELYVESSLHSCERSKGCTYLLRVQSVSESDGCSSYSILDIDPSRYAYDTVSDDAARVVEVEVCETCSVSVSEDCMKVSRRVII